MLKESNQSHGKSGECIRGKKTPQMQAFEKT